MRQLTSLHAFVFLGALLLFTLEPLVGRMLLPYFGGAFHVWTTSLMFFQGALFVAYLYAHLLADRLGPWHLLVVALPLALLPPSVGGGSADSATSLAILARLVTWVALPFGVLATTAVVAQRWRARSGEAPYALYAVSNAGSLGALLVYALLIEPLVGVEVQRWAWAAGFVAYVALAVFTWRRVRGAAAPVEAATEETPPPAATTMLYWALLSAAPSAFLMAVTNLIALEAGNVPLVWIVPLAIYLGSFVVAFADPKDGEVSRVPRLVRRLWPHVAAVGVFFYSGGDAGGGWLDAVMHLVVLGFVTLAAHAELYRRRPDARWLTLYYLVIAAGGGAGGALVALLAPIAFRGLWEYPLALAVLAVTMLIGRREELGAWLKGAPKLALLVSAALVVVIVVKVGAGTAERDTIATLEVRRSFYGVYRVTRTPRGEGAVRDLVSGTTRHGRQRERDGTPLSYYHPRGPLGDVFAVTNATRIAVVGLGVGAAAGHLRPGQHMRFFEIDPVVVELARRHFSYLARAGDAAEVVVGDARVMLERERQRGEPPYDLLLVDAFAGDAIPAHLVTEEAMRLYLDRLTPTGTLVLHVSNRYYDLRPILRANAADLGLEGVHVARVDDLALDQDPSQYVALARTEAPLEPLRTRRGWRRLRDTPALAGAQAWTDDHVSPLRALVW
ncbi:MAG: fused MFS/spermidine synthase [Sandaracinaceae bacterium]|nr:fused MFS/spermidine synthase [Sandaracinaceae bacterium]